MISTDFLYGNQITAYEGSQKESDKLNLLAVDAYFALGIIQERWKQDYCRAKDYYQKSWDNAADDQTSKQRAENQLGIMQTRCPENATDKEYLYARFDYRTENMS